MRKKFKTSQEWVDFFNEFTLWGKAAQMRDYYYNLLEKRWELAWNYKKKNEIIWDMFGDWEEVIWEIDWGVRHVSCPAFVWYYRTEKEKVDYLNEMLEWYEWYIN